MLTPQFFLSLVARQILESAHDPFVRVRKPVRHIVYGRFGWLSTSRHLKN
jgi:hypothetical protein